MPVSLKTAFSLWPILAVLAGLWWLENAWSAILLYHAPVVLGAVLSPGRIKEVLMGFKPWPSLGGIGLGLASIPSVIFALPWLVGMSGGEVGEVLHQGLMLTGLSESSFWFFFAYFVLVHPLVEELGWRSFLHTESPKVHGLDLMFAGYHLLVLGYFFPSGWFLLPVAFLVLAGSGWLWRQMREKFGGLASVIVFHAAADAGIMLAVWWLAFGERA